MEIARFVRHFFKPKRTLWVSVFCFLTLVPARAEPVFNLSNTVYESESREASLSLLQSIQLIFEAIILLEQRDFSGAEGMLAESRFAADNALELYRKIEAAVEMDGGEQEVKNLQEVLRQNSQTAQSSISFSEEIGLGAPENLAEVVALGTRELSLYADQMRAVNFGEPPFFDAVNRARLAINRVFFVGAVVPALTGPQE